MRISLIGKKIGMTQIPHGGSVVPVTLIKIEQHNVLRVKTLENDGYNAVCFAVGSDKEKNISKPQIVEFKNNNVTPSKLVFEVRISDGYPLKSLESTTVNPAEINWEGVYVDASGVSIGKGFAGAMKRWNFRGLEASHGVSVSHRSHGSTGHRQDPGRVFKGKKMAGHLGTENCTVQNLKVLGFDSELSCLLIHGSVPGFEGSYVQINDAAKMGRVTDFTSLNNVNLLSA